MSNLEKIQHMHILTKQKINEQNYKLYIYSIINQIFRLIEYIIVELFKYLQLYCVNRADACIQSRAKCLRPREHDKRLLQLADVGADFLYPRRVARSEPAEISVYTTQETSSNVAIYVDIAIEEASRPNWAILQCRYRLSNALCIDLFDIDIEYH